MDKPSIGTRMRAAIDVFRRGYPWQRQPAPGEGKGANFMVWPDYKSGAAQWRMIDLEAYIEEGWSINTLIYSALMYKARASVAATLRAYAGDPDEPELLPAEHPLSKLAARPNPSQSWREFQMLQTIWLNMAGESIAWCDRKGAERGVPSAVYSLNPLRTFIVPNPRGKRGVMGYIYVPQNRGTQDGYPLLPQDVMHVKLPNPADEFDGDGYGFSPISPTARSADVDNQITKFLEIFFEKGAVLTGLLSFDDKLDKPIVDGIRARWNEIYSGVDNWQIGVLDRGGKYQPIGLPFDEMGFDALDERNESRILGPFGLPPILIGSRLGLNRSTYANYKEARQAFWEDTEIPELMLFQDEYQYFLQSDDGGFVQFDTSDVPALKQDAQSKALIAGDAFSRGAITKNEYRTAIGLDEAPDGKVYFMPLTAIPVAATTEQAGASAAGMENAEEDTRETEKALAVRDPSMWLNEAALMNAVDALNQATKALKNSEDQPRDELGRFGEGGGSGESQGQDEGSMSEFNALSKNPSDMREFISKVVGDHNGAVGLRGLYEDEGIGELRDSRAWEDGEPTGERLSGTSAINVSADWRYDPNSVIESNIKRYANDAKRYGDGKVGIVIGDPAEGGNDPGEIIIPNARVVYVWNP